MFSFFNSYSSNRGKNIEFEWNGAIGQEDSGFFQFKFSGELS
jgi:hypothetical protein